MEHELLERGIPEEEVHRAVIAYFSQPEPPPAQNWPGPVTGVDLAVSHIYNVTNPPYPHKSLVWDGLASQTNSEPSMHGEYGFNVKKSVPEWQYPIEDSQIGKFSIPNISIPSSGTNPLTEATAEDKKKDWKKLLLKWALLLGGAAGIDKIIDNQDPSKPLEIFGRYTATIDSKTCPACEKANGSVFNILETHDRPVLPSENLGYTTRHPNCRCKWQILDNYKGKTKKLNKTEENKIHNIEDHIASAAKKGDLHKVRKDGKLSNRTTKKIQSVKLVAARILI